MPKYQVKYIFSDGEDSYEDELFDTEAEAEEAGQYGCSCYHQGYDELHMSIPGDYSCEDELDVDYEVIEIDD